MKSEIQDTSILQGGLEGTTNPLQWFAFVSEDMSRRETPHLRYSL
jgi:hypothetical protein